MEPFWLIIIAGATVVIVTVLFSLSWKGASRARLREPFQADECRWFRRAVEQKVILVQSYVPSCPQNKEPEHPRRDEFTPIDRLPVPA